jgi:hypothetical protein
MREIGDRIGNSLPEWLAMQIDVPLLAWWMVMLYQTDWRRSVEDPAQVVEVE